MRNRRFIETGRSLAVLLSVWAMNGTGAAEPNPAAAPMMSAEEIREGQAPSTRGPEPSEDEAHGPAAAARGEAAWQLPPIVARPEFLSRRRFIPDFLLKDKPEGRFVTGVPAIAWDQETGLTLGVLGFLFDNGQKADPFFRTTPYRQKISVEGLEFMSGGRRYTAALDQPNVSGGPYRLRAEARYAADPLENYFGFGGTAMQDFHFPGAPGRFFPTYSGYQDALRRESNGFAYTKYDKYESREISLAVAVERDMFGGIVRPLVGLTVRHTAIGDLTGEGIDAVDPSGRDVEAIEQPTRMHTDCLAGMITGCNGGFDNILKLGLSLDTRDFEPDPYSGVLAQVASELSAKALGSDFEYQRVSLSVSGYRSLFPRVARLVLAGRGLYSMQFGNVPFFSLPTLALNERDISGLGGFATMRGFVDHRFVGDSAVLVNSELRWSIFDGGYVFGQHLRPMLVPFADAGRVFDGTRLRFDGWRANYGIGFRVIWDTVTVASFDFGVSSEQKIFRIDLGHAF